MANEIYTMTRDGLESLVSRQVAEHVLARALEKAGSDSATVDGAQMSRLLRGRVRRELERSLPSRAVRRCLAELDAKLELIPAAEVQPAPDRPNPVLEPIPARPSTAGTAPRALPSAILDRISDTEAIRQWMWAPAAGSVEGRGSGPDPDRTFRLFAPLATVLERSGAVRSIHVHHGRGHVLFGRDRGSTLAVAGDDDLNLGAIYATFRALEEEP